MRTFVTGILTLATIVIAGFVMEGLAPDFGRVERVLARVYGPPKGRGFVLVTWALAGTVTYIGFAVAELASWLRIFLAVFALPSALFVTFVSMTAYRGSPLERDRRLPTLARILALAIAVLSLAAGVYLIWAGDELRMEGIGMLVFGAVFGASGIRGTPGAFLGPTPGVRPPSDPDSPAV